MATHDYVPVTADDWYQRRRQDDEGKFFRAVASQGPRKGEGGATRQGIYCLTADGKLLAYKNAGQAPDVMRETLRQGLKEWKKLPAERRQPGAVRVDDAGTVDKAYARTPPPGGLILRVYTRILERENGAYRRGTCETLGADKAARDHLWITEAEWKSLLPREPRTGDTVKIPGNLAERILRFHLTDNTRGEPPKWQREELRRHELSLTITEVTANEVQLRLQGSALLATDADPSKAKRGFDVQLVAQLRYDRRNKQFDRFDLIAVGDHWGEGPFTRNARPGRQPLGVAFELASGKDAADRVPPQAARDLREYLGRQSAP
jgi:hypothetical protein